MTRSETPGADPPRSGEDDGPSRTPADPRATNRALERELLFSAGDASFADPQEQTADHIPETLDAPTQGLAALAPLPEASSPGAPSPGDGPSPGGGPGAVGGPSPDGGPSPGGGPSAGGGAPGSSAPALYVWSEDGRKTTSPEGPRRRAEAVLPDETSKGKADRAPARRTPTGIAIPRLPLPPPTEHGERPRIRVRRSESVIAEAVQEKRAIHGLEEVARRASTQVSGVFSRSVSAAGWLRERSMRSVKRFEAMPRQKQILWVAAPYVVVLLLALALFQLRATPNVIEARSLPARAADVPAPAGQHAPGGALAAPAVSADPQLAAQTTAAPVLADMPARTSPEKPAPGPGATPLEILVAREARREPSPGPSPGGAAGWPEGPGPREGARAADGAARVDAKPTSSPERAIAREWRTLPIDASLRARADGKARKVLKLQAGTRVATFPEFPVEEGWILAQSPEGEIGFLKRSSLEATPTEDGRPLRSKAPKERELKPKRAKTSKVIDPFEAVERASRGGKTRR